MNRHEAEQIAAAINLIRGDWPAKQITTILGRGHQHRPARDALMALVWIAYDPETQTPARIDADGPWWACSRLAGVPEATPPLPRCDRHGDWLPCLVCQRETVTPADPAEVAAILDRHGIKRGGGRTPALTEPTAITAPTERMPRLTDDQINTERNRQLAALEAITEEES